MAESANKRPFDCVDTTSDNGVADCTSESETKIQKTGKEEENEETKDKNNDKVTNDSEIGASENSGIEKEKAQDEKVEEKEEILASTGKEKTESKFVFGSATSFGNMGGFKMFGSDKNVFSSSSIANDKDTTKPKSEVEPTVDAKTNKSTEETATDDSKAKESTPTTKSVFGSGATFGNAFQAAINKKSVFDELKSATVDNDSDSSVDKEVYKKVHLEKQNVKSGEENEETLFIVRAKLYHMELSKMSLGWKERGFGVIKVNKFFKPLADNYTSRLVMRQNGNLKLILNLPIVNGLNVLKGMPSSLTANKFIRLQVLENGEPVQYAIKVGQPENAEKLFDIIQQQIPE